jgi:lipopolysaccharide export system permease protein
MYTDHYEERNKLLKGVIIHDGRNQSRPMTIFAQDGVISGASGNNSLLLSLRDGSIHMAGEDGLYRLVHFGEYSMTVGDKESSTPLALNESDLWLSDLKSLMNDPAVPANIRLKHLTEFHSRFTFPCASFVFGILAVPLGIQNRRAGKSGGFAVSILIILSYYVMMSVAKTFPEKGILPSSIALWLPNLVFLGIGLYFLRMASLEKNLPRLQLISALDFFRRST